MPVRAIDETTPPSAVQPLDRLPSALAPTRDDVSTLTKAEPLTPSYTPSKPTLEPPSTSPLFDTFRTLETRTEPLIHRWLHGREDRIEKHFSEIQAMHTEQARQMDEAVTASKNVSFWGILEDIASTVSAAIGFFFGTSAALAGSTVVGGALIASGVLTVGNLAFKHGHVWGWVADQMAGNDKQLREQILTYLPSAVGLSATALSFAGAYGAWKYAGQTGFQVTNHLLQSTVNISDSLIHYKSGMASYDQKGILGDLSALQSNTDLSRMDLEKLISDVQEYHEHQTDMHATLGKILEERDQAIQLVQQPV